MLAGFRTRARRLTNSYVFSRVPFMNLLILGLQLLGISHVSWSFSAHFEVKPVLTTMITNSILSGIADTVAQTVSAYRKRHSIVAPTNPKKVDRVSIEIHELGEKSLPTHRAELFAAPHFDIDRLVRYMAWGFLMAPLQLSWFAWLSGVFPATEGHQTAAVMWRVFLDQIVFSPISLAAFFLFMGLCEGSDLKAVRRKMNVVFIPALKSNYVVWPAVQIFNFRVVPLQYQLPFASTVGICWTTYLSLKNEAADALM